jgi:outer membrane protein TolC
VTLEEARAAAMANNLSISVALIDPAISAQALRAEEAKFEAVFTPNIAYAETDRPTFNRTTSNSQDDFRAGAGVALPLRTGGRASIGFSESYSQTDNPFVTLNQAYSPSIDFGLSIPLLRGAGRRVNTYSIRVAAINQQITEAATRLSLIRTLADVDRAYWVLDALRRELQVRRDELGLRGEQAGRARRLVDAGAAGDIEIVRAESAAAATEELIIVAANAVRQQERALKRLMNRPDLPVESPTEVVATSAPDPVAYSLDRPRMVGAAVENRSEMLELELRLAADYSTIEFEKNRALPSFVLDYRYSIDGLGPSHASGFQTLTGNDFESWSVSLNGEIPLGNRAARARVNGAILARLQRLATRDARRQAITEEVLSATDELEAGWRRIVASERSVRAAERAFEAEDRLFRAGGNTSIDTLNAVTDLAEARSRAVRAVANYQVARVNLAFATGTLLGASRIDWSPVDRSADPGADPTPPAFPFYSDPEKVPPPRRAAGDSMWGVSP